MAQIIKCDGCSAELKPNPNHAKGEKEHIIHGGRVNEMRGGGVPDRDFDWCLEDAQAAFDAVRARRS
jgi:hypothetical protein